GAGALLEKFIAKHPDGWQVTAAAHLLGQLLLEAKDYHKAGQVFYELGAKRQLPADVRERFQLLSARAVMVRQEYTRASAKLQAIAEQLPRGSPQRLATEVYQAECLAENKQFAKAEKLLTEILEKSNKDDEVLAVAYNALGQCQFLQNRAQDALW